MILKPISAKEAFDLLMNKEAAGRVFFKTENRNAGYRVAESHLWLFGHGSGGIDFRKAQFFLEEEYKEVTE